MIRATMAATAIEPEAAIAPGAVAAPTTTFDDLLTRHKTELYRYAVRLTRNRTDADDLYQETLLKAYRAFGRLDGAANHRAWLYRIATNTFLSDRRRSGPSRALDEPLHVAGPGERSDYAADLDARELLREVAAFVSRLPVKQRGALILRKYHGVGYAEIAARLECSEGAARVNVYEALRKLRDRFGDRL
jgi:RNA polymerase sigma-70 factor (ECF subfamily)